MSLHRVRLHQLLFVVICLSTLTGCPKKGGKGKLDESALEPENLVATSEPQEDIVDPDYQFRMKAPSRQWKLLKEHEVQAIVPDAIAGANHIDGPSGVIIIEPVGPTPVANYAQLIYDNNTGQGQELDPMEETTFLGLPAITFQHRFNARGIDIEYHYLMFVHQNYGYQLLVGGPALACEDFHVQEFRDAFSLTDGKVQSRGASGPISDFYGVGRRIVNARFESALSGIAYDFTEGWRPMIDANFQESHPDAEIGMKSSETDLYMSITMGDTGDSTLEENRDALLDSVEQNLHIAGKRFDSVGDVAVTLNEQEVSFRQYKVKSGLPMTYLVGVYPREDQFLQIIAWWLQSNEEASLQTAKKGIGKIEILSADDWAQLRTEMLSSSEGPTEVGSNWSLRNGVYRDFQYGFIWKKPKGFWRVAADTDAQPFNPAARLVAREMRMGLIFQVIIQPRSHDELAQAHREFSEDIFGDTYKEGKALLGGEPGLTSTGQNVDENAMHYLISAPHNGHVIHVLVTGSIERMKQYANDVNQAVIGMSFQSTPFQPIIQTPNLYKDIRVGFEFRLPNNQWQVRAKPIPHFQAMGNAVEFSKDGQHVLVMGVCSITAGQDDSVSKNMIKEVMQANMSRFANVTPDKFTSEFAGLTWEARLWEVKSERMWMLITSKNQTVWVILAGDNAKTPGFLETVKSRFSLLK